MFVSKARHEQAVHDLGLELVKREKQLAMYKAAVENMLAQRTAYPNATVNRILLIAENVRSAVAKSA